jgi:hypothetical protein
MLGIKTVTNGPIFEISSAFLLRHAAWLISFSLDGVITHTLGAANSRAFFTEEPRFRKPGWCWRLGTKRESRRRR